MATYIFSHRTIYESFSFQQLCERFQLERTVIYRKICSMIWSGELAASITEDHVVLHPTYTTEFTYLTE
jgi:hypothetical protein